VARIACGVEYDGGRFAGWQRQARGTPSVQAAVEQALSRVANHPVEVVCAGRTDSGVHATTQVFHFDVHVRRPEKAWVMGANTALPADVALRWARAVPDSFHARYSARQRRYRYVILEGWDRPALWRQRAAWEHARLDIAAMQDAGARLVGEHDFSAFRSAACQARHAWRRLEAVEVERRGRAVLIDVVGNAFLHNMVRIIAGVLMAIGRGDQTPVWVDHLLAVGDRTQAGMTAPARGLYFIGPVYPPEFGLPDPDGPQWPGSSA
jgi:tRNA pseudouridine38-40 synthase